MSYMGVGPARVFSVEAPQRPVRPLMSSRPFLRVHAESRPFELAPRPVVLSYRRIWDLRPMELDWQ